MSRPQLGRSILNVIRCALPVIILTAIIAVLAPGQRPAETAAQSEYDRYNQEAKAYLTSIADAQITYFVANNYWAGYPDGAGVFKALGWEPSPQVHYAYYCGNDYLPPQKSDYPYNYPNTKANWPFGLYPDVTLSDFVCLAIGNNDKDEFPDVWMIDKYRMPAHVLDDATNKVLVNVVAEPFDAEQFFAKAYETQNPNGPTRVYLEINLAAYRLDLYVNGHFLKSFPIAIGMLRYKTPLRDFWVDHIEWNPWWIPPDAPWARKTNELGEKERIKPKPPGPGNPLGPVKLVLQSAILVHGTNAPKSIGHAASHSCMRMQSDNAVDLAWKVMVLAGTKQPLMKKEVYRDKSRRTYMISLLTDVQVTTVYRRIEVYNNFVLLHTDPYGYQPLSPDAIKAKLSEFGIPLESLGEGGNALFVGKLKSTLYVPIKF